MILKLRKSKFCPYLIGCGFNKKEGFESIVRLRWVGMAYNIINNFIMPLEKGFVNTITN